MLKDQVRISPGMQYKGKEIGVGSVGSFWWHRGRILACLSPGSGGSWQPLALLTGSRITALPASAFTEHSPLSSLLVRTLDFGFRAQPKRSHLDTLNYIYTHPLCK